uniref:Uncharacterized protein n=1 Tax=Meloidogyne incognita TaxID=6306 RepID=A0A914NT60_MELIC
MKKVQERFHRRMERKRASSADQQRRSSSAALNEQQRLNKSFDNRRQSTTSTLGEGGQTNLLSPEMTSENENKKQNKSIRKRVNSWFGQTSQDKENSDENLMNLTPDQLEIAELGKPRLGEFRKCQITIKESKEFQYSMSIASSMTISSSSMVTMSSMTSPMSISSMTVPMFVIMMPTVGSPTAIKFYFYFIFKLGNIPNFYKKIFLPVMSISMGMFVVSSIIL